LQKEFAKLLDQLMGKDRNKPLSQQKAKATSPDKIDFASRSLCPYFLVSACPHELFINTKVCMLVVVCPLAHYVVKV
jgi:hypothetical protein